MKRIKNIIPLFTLVVILTVACQKQPSAEFTTDKTEYIAGETIQLNNTSKDGSSYQWAMPNGTIVNTTNTTYPIDRNFGFGALTFNLNAESKNGKKFSSVSHSVNVIPASVFSIDSTPFTYYPLNVSCYPFNSNWLINSYFKPYFPQGLSYNDANAYMAVEFYGNQPPTSGVYQLQSNDLLSPGYAYILIKRDWWEDNWEQFISLSGQLTITIVNGKINATFNNIDAVKTDRWGTIYPTAKISGNITCH